VYGIDSGIHLNEKEGVPWASDAAWSETTPQWVDSPPAPEEDLATQQTAGAHIDGVTERQAVKLLSCDAEARRMVASQRV